MQPTAPTEPRSAANLPLSGLPPSTNINPESKTVQPVKSPVSNPQLAKRLPSIVVQSGPMAALGPRDLFGGAIFCCACADRLSQTSKVNSVSAAVASFLAKASFVCMV